jgi:hypothetical protein
MPEKYLRALFLLAGIEVQGLFELANGYWPDQPDYAELRRENPWWLVKTNFGMVRIGWRKRVINIDWEDTPVRAIVTTDDVTKDETMVHAYGYAKAVSHLQAWHREASRTVPDDGKDGGA